MNVVTVFCSVRAKIGRRAAKKFIKTTNVLTPAFQLKRF